MKSRKKLIEVALPLDAINKAAVREKSIRHGHPSTLHLWWARRPLAAARAVIFGQMVDDPSSYVEDLLAQPNLKRKAESTLKARLKRWEEATALAKKGRAAGTEAPDPGEKPTLEDTIAEIERQRLFRIIEALVLWKNTTNEEVLQAARDEIWQSWRRACADNADHQRANELFDRHKLPGFHDPFAGGGALPLEAQRLGLESYASDLNPVAVLITKAMIEIPPKFAGRPPVSPEARKNKDLFVGEWKGAQGLAEDVRHYGQWMRDEAEKRIGHLYPKVEVTAEMTKGRPDLKRYLGKKLTVIAWLWARTVKSPNPAFSNVSVPLASSFMLSTKPGKEAYVEPVIEGDRYRFRVSVGKPKDAEAAKRGTTASKWNAFRCLMSDAPITYDYIRGEGTGNRMGNRLMAVVAEGDRERIYISPTEDMERTAQAARPTWGPELAINHHPRDIKTQIYGLTKYIDLFTPRQLVALTTLADLVQEARELVQRDALDAGLPHDGKPFRDGGTGATAYADAIAVYLSFSVDKAADYWSAICTWHSSKELIRNTFGRQAIPMSWDYVETNIFSQSSGNVSSGIEWAQKALCIFPASPRGIATQGDAQTQELSSGRVVSTDPPYYDNIGYADLSDFFYVWLRRSLRPVFPDVFATLAVPKAEELVATPYRHGSKEKAETFFLVGMTQAMRRLAEQAHPAFPVTIYYAFKQAETDGGDGTASTGWDTFLGAVIEAGFAISGTWPMRTELGNRMIGSGSNALASSIILVCRPRTANAPTVTRRQFVTALKAELPQALAHLQRGNIAPVDLAQAAIGPGMAVYTRYANVLDAAGNPLSVREALALINQTLDESLAEQEADFDPDTRWALTWFEEQGFTEGPYGKAEQLSKSKNTSVGGMVEAGIVESKRGKVRLLAPEDLPASWDPTTDPRLTAWEMVHHLIRILEADGEPAAGRIVAKLGTKAEVARELCYRLYTICERQKCADDALRYNALVQSWPEIVRLAGERAEPQQPSLMGA
jgi:putative DNA methylase